MSQPIDHLTAAMAAGDEAAVSHFYGRYFDQLLAHARRATRRDEAFCLDVVQDAVLRIIRSVRRVDSDSQFDAWLRLVVQTCAFDRMRKERRRTARERVVAGSRGESLPPSDPAYHSDQLSWLRRQIGTLDPQLTQLIELRYEQRLTLTRIAGLLGLTTGTVDGRLRRAIVTLRRKAREDFDE